MPTSTSSCIASSSEQEDGMKLLRGLEIAMTIANSGANIQLSKYNNHVHSSGV